MKRSLCVAVLLCAGSMFAQQQGHPPPFSTPPTFPEEDKKPSERIPPESAPEPVPPERNPAQKLPPDIAAEPSSTQVEAQLQTRLDNEPLLSGAGVKADVDDGTVILSGTVENEEQHNLALRIAHGYAGDRQIDDRIKVRARS